MGRASKQRRSFGRAHRVSHPPACRCGRESYEDRSAGLCCVGCGLAVKQCECGLRRLSRRVTRTNALFIQEVARAQV